MGNEMVKIGDAKGLKAFTERESVKDAIQKAFPRKMHVGQFMLAAMLSAKKVPALYDCSQESWYAAMLSSAQIGLFPDGVHGALVPYKGSIKFQPMYQGLEALARRYHLIRSINTQLVYVGEAFTFEDVDGHVTYSHKPEPMKRTGYPKDVAGAYFSCVYVDEAGDQRIYLEWMHKEDLVRIKQKALKEKKTPNNPDLPWNSDECEMYRKSVSKRAWKRIPKDDTMTLAASMMPDRDPVEDAVVLDAQDVTVKTVADRTNEIVDRAVAAREVKADPPQDSEPNTPSKESATQPTSSSESGPTTPEKKSTTTAPPYEEPPLAGGSAKSRMAAKIVDEDGTVLKDREPEPPVGEDVPPSDDMEGFFDEQDTI